MKRRRAPWLGEVVARRTFSPQAVRHKVRMACGAPWEDSACMAKGQRNRRQRGRRLSEAETRLLRSDAWAKTIGKLGHQIIPWSGICILGYLAHLVLIEWTGQTTIAEVTVALRATGWQGLTALAGLAVGVAGVTYGHSQARLRRKTILHLGPRIKELETAHDPDRSSSGLTASGETPQED